MAGVYEIIDGGFKTALHYVSATARKEYNYNVYEASIRNEIYIEATREKLNSKQLKLYISVGAAYGYAGWERIFALNINGFFTRQVIVFTPNSKDAFNVNNNWEYDRPFPDEIVIFSAAPDILNEDNVDKDDGSRPSIVVSKNGENKTALISTKNSYIRLYTFISGNAFGSESAQAEDKQNLYYAYPPYISDTDIITDVKGNGAGKLANDGADGTSNAISLTRNYSITYPNGSVTYSWTPNATSNAYGINIYSDLTVNGTTYSMVTSPKSVNAPNSNGAYYTAQVKRYFDRNADLENVTSLDRRSNTLGMYTYSRPTLSSISLSKNVISAFGNNNDNKITITLNGGNNRAHSVENNFRTGIWSNYASKYNIDVETTSQTYTLTNSDIKALSPDTRTNANVGYVDTTIHVTRRNLGISGGNPGNGSLVYETEEKTATYRVYYKPTKTLNTSGSDILYYKVENNIQGNGIEAGTTWLLPNTYNIGNMTGINVRLKYSKTDDAGVLSGYKIELLLPNDGTHGTDYVWYTTYWFTTDEDYTGLLKYADIKKGINGNRIRITPFYRPSNVGSSEYDKFWYGPSVTKNFVDIVWQLDNPVIDCPLTGTTWHNNSFRILFKLPNDKDLNDIQTHYGANTYRYQEIQVRINNVITNLGNNVYMNAQNNWNSVTNITNARLTFKRAIIINPKSISTFPENGPFTISLRVRKAYGQNSNFDGWSNWSSDIVVYRQDVSNTNVSKGQLILASHYMNVQSAFNRSVACYAKTNSDNKDFVVKTSIDRVKGDIIRGPDLPSKSIMEYVFEFNDLHNLKNKINSYGTFDTDKDRNSVKLDSSNKLLSNFTPSQEYITAEKDQTTGLVGRNYMKYMCDELNNLK